MSALPSINIDKPKYDQSTYINRAKHFFLLTNPINLFASNAELERARRIVQNYKAGKPDPDCKTVDDLWRAKYLYDSAFHKGTGEKSIIIGRMSAQVPMNTSITGCMLTFYKTAPAVAFWQCFNQSFNALVNYTNRSGSSSISKLQLILSIVSSTTGALTTALYLNRFVKNLHPIIGRLVPLAAITVGSCINVPMMRLQEIHNGVELFDENGNKVGVSQVAAVAGIASVVVTRFAMRTPGMTLSPLFIEKLTKNQFLVRYPWANAPIQILCCGFFLIFSCPLALAIFSQQTWIKVSRLEKDIKEKILQNNPKLESVWFNKGL